MEYQDGKSFGTDVDNDGKPDWLDTDSDGDGVDDGKEGRVDTNGNGVPAYLDPTELGNQEHFVVEGGSVGGCTVDPSKSGYSTGLWLLLGLLFLALFKKRNVRD